MRRQQRAPQYAETRQVLCYEQGGAARGEYDVGETGTRAQDSAEGAIRHEAAVLCNQGLKSVVALSGSRSQLRMGVDAPRSCLVAHFPL